MSNKILKEVKKGEIIKTTPFEIVLIIRDIMKGNRKKTKKAPNLTKKFLHMLIKQTVAALLCLLISLGMHKATFSHLNAYADALGRAMRHESDFSKLVQIGYQMTDKLKSLLSFYEETSL